MSILNEIVRNKREEIARNKKQRSQRMIMRTIDTEARDFIGALSMPGVSLIAEIKYRSPSRGIVPDQRDPVTRAHAYEQYGARALSVLTDDCFFGGRPEYLAMVRAATPLPVLRKDFIIDEYQIYESRALGADAVLLIVRLLPQHDLERFIAVAHELAMTPLVEVHEGSEVNRALAAHAECIGVNNRDLDTLNVDIERSLCLKKTMPDHCVTVAESGIATRDDMKRIEDAGFHGVLIGHALADAVRAHDVPQLLRGGSYESA